MILARKGIIWCLFEYINGRSNEIDPREEMLMGDNKKMNVSPIKGFGDHQLEYVTYFLLR